MVPFPPSVWLAFRSYFTGRHEKRMPQLSPVGRSVFLFFRLLLTAFTARPLARKKPGVA